LNDILAIDNAHFEATQLKAELEQRLDRLNKADKLLGQAQQFLTAGDYGRAREQCGQALALAPAHAAGLKLRTEIETAQRRSAGAVSFLAQARAALKALRPTDLPEQALKFIAQAIELEPTSEEGLKLRQEALEHQERANKLREHLRVGRQALQDRHYEDALVAFEQALAYDRANEEIRSLRDRSREARDRQAEVEKWVRQGQAHLNAARYAEAADAFGKALVQGPDDEAQVLTLLAKAREGARNEQVHSLLQQASSEIESGNDEAAGKALAALKALAPNDPDLMKLEPFVDLIRRGQAAHGAGQYAQALEAYGQASKLWPASRRLANLIAQTRGAAGLVDRLLSAQAHLEARRYSEAIADVQSILALDPRYPQAQELAQGIVAQLLEEARNAHARGEYRSALAFCAQALDVGVDNEKARTLQQTIASEAANQVVGSVVAAEKALQEGDLATADQAITRGLRIEPEHKRLLALLNTLRERERVRREADMLVEHGREALHARDYSAAQASFAEAVRADGRHREAPRWHQFALWLAEGIAIFKQERYAEAASRFGQAVALFAESTNAPPELAEAQRLKKEATECDGIIGQMTQLLAEADRLRQERNYLAAREALTKLLTLRFPGDVAQSAAGGE